MPIKYKLVEWDDEFYYEVDAEESLIEETYAHRLLLRYF